MPERHLIVTPLPNGKLNSTTGLLSALLAPRLREAGELGDYTDFRDWAANVAGPPGLSFEVVVNGNVLPPAAVSRVSPPADAAVWRALFGPPANSHTPVEPASFIDRAGASFTSMDTAALTELTTDLYRAVAAMGGVADRATLGALADPVLTGPLPTAQLFTAPIGNGEEPIAKGQEFHSVLRQLQSHPRLLRLLGLVVDFQITLPASFSEVSVRTNWAAATGAGARAEVALRMKVDANFEPLVVETAFRAGRWLSFGSSKYTVAQLSAIDTAAGLEQLVRALDASADGEDVDLPALEDGGLSIISDETVAKLARSITRQRLIEDGIDAYITGVAAQPPQIVAEDVAAGVRIDVEDAVAPATYRSLHRRQTGAYSLPRNPALVVVPPADEGWSSQAVFTDGTSVILPKTSPVTYGEGGVRKSEKSDTTHWRVDDSMLTWSGWSLSAARPSRILDGEGNVIPRPVNAPAPGDQAQLVVDYVVQPATLPKLRYGHTYRFQGRAVDLAGNSPATTDPPTTTARSPQITYGRTRPVFPPIAVRRASRPDPGVGDTVDVLVIKSELTQTNGTVTPAQRMLFPSNISQHQLEQHGMPNGGNDPGSYALLAARDAVSLADQCIVDPDTGEFVAGTALVSGAVTPGPLRPPVNYLPDPAGRAVAFSGLPAAAAPISMTFGTWPTYRGVMLELRAGTAAPTVSNANQSVSVQLAKATEAVVTVSAAIDAALLPHFKWFQSMSPTDQASVTASITSGRSAIFSPRRLLTLIHAVRIPLNPPSFTAGAVTASRTEVGQTTTVLAGTVNCHGNSTEHLAIRSRWVDPIDDVTQPAPGQLTQRKVVGDVQAGGTGVDPLTGLSIDLGDTKRHQVEIDAEAFCKYSRFFTERRDVSAVLTGTTLLNANGVAASSVVVSDRTTGARFAEGTDYTVDAVAGRLRVLATGTITAGTLLRIEFIPLPVSRRSSEAAAGTRTATFSVPASARPAPPVVAHILPAFSRTTSATATVLTVNHDGRVLRVFLERPWYSSGTGEMLGVAIDPAAVANRLLTRWARDPLTLGPGATVDPTTSSFTSRTATAALIDGKFDVAGHDVVFDTDRGLWTADVAVDASFGYRPFVQLALCRYQPLAVAGEHVSETVMPDAIRLGAQRTVTVTRLSGGRATVRVTGPDNVNSMQVTLQQADAAISDPELRWVSLGAAQTLTRSGSRTASVHTRTISVAPTNTTRRLLIEDREPVKRQVGAVLQNQFDVVYREVIELPSTW